MLEESGFVDIVIGPPVDTFGGAGGEQKARAFDVYGYAFLARKPVRRATSPTRQRDSSERGPSLKGETLARPPCN
jgi:hypothetical protein